MKKQLFNSIEKAAKATGNWRDMAETPALDERMPMTTDHFMKMMALDDELIKELQLEIQALKLTINQLRQRIKNEI